MLQNSRNRLAQLMLYWAAPFMIFNLKLLSAENCHMIFRGYFFIQRLRSKNHTLWYYIYDVGVEGTVQINQDGKSSEEGKILTKQIFYFSRIF